MRTGEEARLAEEARQKAEEHKRAGLKIEEGLRLALEARMFLCFLPYFFGKACLFVSPQQACFSSLRLQQGVHPLWPLSLRAPPPLPISVPLQGLGVPPLLPSSMRAYAPLLW